MIGIYVKIVFLLSNWIFVQFVSEIKREGCLFFDENVY